MIMMRYFLLFFCVAMSAFGAPLPENVREAVEQMRKYDYSQPRTAPHTLEQFAPKADAEQQRALAAMLAKAIEATDTTAEGRTILCQRLVLVANDAQMSLVRKWLGEIAISKAKPE